MIITSALLDFDSLKKKDKTRRAFNLAENRVPTSSRNFSIINVSV